MLASSFQMRKRPESVDVSTASGLGKRKAGYAPGRFIWQLVGVLDT